MTILGFLAKVILRGAIELRRKAPRLETNARLSIHLFYPAFFLLILGSDSERSFVTCHAFRYV